MKKLLLTLAAVAAAIGAANAQTVIDIVGSSAGRTAVHNNILATLNQGTTTWAYDGTDTSGLKGTRYIYHGTFGGNVYTIRAYYAGSVNGVEDVQKGIQQTELFDTSVVGTAGGQRIEPATPKATASAETVPEIGFSDVFASSTGKTGTDVDDKVGIIEFQWYANNGSTALAGGGITANIVQYLYKNLEAPLSLFTGNSTDSGTVVSAIGRNSDSGTRITALAESGYGVFKSVDQYGASITVSGGAVTNLGTDSNNGASSGGTVKGAINATYSGGVLVGYLGASDFAASGVPLKWNGVAYSQAAIREGQYTFWGYLHQTRQNTLTGNGLAFYNQLKTNIVANPSPLLADDANMHVKRDGDGAPVYHK